MRMRIGQLLAMRKLRTAESKSSKLSNRLKHARDASADLRNHWRCEQEAISQVRGKIEQAVDDLALVKNELKDVASEPEVRRSGRS